MIRINNMIPCIKNKCILLPVCKQKISVKCEKLYNIYKIIHTDPIIKSFEYYDEGFFHLMIDKEFRNILPNLTWVENHTHSYHVNNENDHTSISIMSHLSTTRRKEIEKFINEVLFK